MEKPKLQPTQTGRIPVLFDIVERGKNAPEENQVKPPPPAEKTEFRLGDAEAGSEDPTVLPGFDEPNSGEFSLDMLDDVTQENPIISEDLLSASTLEMPTIPPDMLEDTTQENPDIPDDLRADGDNQSAPGSAEDATMEAPTIPASVIIDSQKSRDELVEKVLWALMPHLEELARETLKKILNDEQDQQDETGRKEETDQQE